MVKEINGSGVSRPPLQNEASIANRGAAARTEQNPEARATTPAASDSVSLSSNAQALKSAGEKLQKLPEVNEKRVADIRAALESGEYKVDDLVIADKLLAAEELFR